GGADQDKMFVGKPVVPEPVAIVEVRNACDDDLFGPDSFSDEQLSVAFTCNTEPVICVAQTGCRRARQPSRKHANTFHQVIDEVLRVSHSFLHENNLLSANVLRNDKIRAGHDEVVIPALSLEIYREVVLL